MSTSPNTKEPTIVALHELARRFDQQGYKHSHAAHGGVGLLATCESDQRRLEGVAEARQFITQIEARAEGKGGRS